MAHYRYWSQRPAPPSTKAQQLGHAVHSLILEPERLLLDYCYYADSKTTGEGARKRWAAFRDRCEAQGTTILDKRDYETVTAAMQAARDNPALAVHLARLTERELTIVWEHSMGRLFKSRIDGLITTDPVGIVDIKTSRNPAPWHFTRDAAKYNYHVQAAIYQDAVEAAYGKRAPYRILAVQNEPPFDSACYLLPDHVVERGREICLELLDQLAECERTDEWPGVCMGEQELELPPWEMGADDDPTGLGLDFGGVE